MQFKFPSRFSSRFFVRRYKAVLLAVAAPFILTFAHTASAQTFTTLYSFPGELAGSYPGIGNLLVGANGSLVGETQQGGDTNCNPGSGCGVVFSLTSNGTEGVLHAFGGAANNDGAEPNGVVANSSLTVLYGTTSSGGANSAVCPNGCGTIFKIEGGKETILHTFTGSPDGNLPIGTPVLDAAGDLFTVTFYGGGSSGSTGNGTLVELNAADQETLLYAFKGASKGTNPNGSLLRDSSGNFYGTTTYGGTGSCNNGFLPGCGVVFKIDSAGNETVLHDFTGKSDGQYPDSLIMDPSGNLYGIAANSANGEVFKIDAAGNFSVIFDSPATAPIVRIIPGPSGSFFGVANGGNPSCANFGCGLVFQLSETNGVWKLNVLHKFNGADGSQPDNLVLSGNVLYGTTFMGGAFNMGTAFKLVP